MKLDFGNINDTHLKIGSVFFLYGNFKRTFDVFCDFISEKIKYKYYEASLTVNFCSINECEKIINNQCDLFGNNINIFCIKNIEDNHIEKLSHFFTSINCIFILESGDYKKSKSITDNFTRDKNIYAVPSFKNDSTIISLCKLFLPQKNAIPLYQDIVKIINNTDEELISLFKKISLLISSGDEKLLKEYITYKNSFTQNLDFIPFARYLMKLALKEKIFEKKQTFVSNDLSKKSVIEKLLQAEINQKVGTPVTKNILNKI
ncbi:MAG: hypothetical protein IJ730_04560 [Alphaproteobacteria bacterium]|nr:hypothetical protein [Alphaproteobacteria bacterium]